MILHQPIDTFDVSESFRLEFLRAGFLTLKDALAFDADTLVNEKKFSYHTITELIELLNSKGLSRLLQE
jgi:hypothetical protein